LLKAATETTSKGTTRRERRDRRLEPFFTDDFKLNTNLKRTDPKCLKVKDKTNEEWCNECFLGR
jgi:hypothetical protein